MIGTVYKAEGILLFTGYNVFRQEIIYT